MSGMVAFATAHAAVVLAWTAAWCAMTGIGALVLRILGGEVRAWRDVSTSFWLGVAATIALLQVWHLVLPVDGRALTVVAVIAATGLLTIRGAVAALPREKLPAEMLLTTVLLLLWVANRGLGPSHLYDTAMYHQPAVNWMNAFAVVPGLGNLHGRLAFNGSSFLLAALFDAGVADRLVFHAFNGWLFGALIIEGIAAIWTVRARTVASPFALFSIAILPFALHGALRREIASLSTDAAVAVMLLAGTRFLCDGMMKPAAGRRQRGVTLSVALTLFAAAVTIKLSAAVFVATALAAGAAWLMRRNAATDAPDAERLPVSLIARWLAPGILLALPWLARGVALSGYPLYPAQALPVNVDWRVPAEQAAAEQAWIVMSAKVLNANAIYPGWSWGRPWLRTIAVNDEMVALFTAPLLVAMGLAAWWLFGGTRRKPPPWAPALVALSLPVVCAGLFWAFTAPHPRMIQGVVWGWLATLAAAHVLARPGTGMRLVAASAAGFVGLASLSVRTDLRDDGGTLSGALLTMPSSEWLRPIPTTSLARFVTAGGLELAVPPHDNRCGNGPLLCTPHPTPALELRDQDNPGRGFRTVGGAWAPERWPNPFTGFLPWWRCVQAAPPDDRDREPRCIAEVSRRP